MNGIKLPVTVATVGEDERDLFFDADNRKIPAWEIAAALNAAPTRAFGELTSKMIGLMVNDVVREVGEQHENATVQEYSDWQKRCDEAMLARLQAFAAPVAPAWQPIETMPMEGFFDVWTPLGHFTRVTKEEVKGNPALIRATHWKPSCAAPEAQGGPDHG